MTTITNPNFSLIQYTSFALDSCKLEWDGVKLKLTRTNLENVEIKVGNSLDEGEETVKRIRIRVITGYTEDGSAIVKRLSAYDELTLADSVVRAVVESGRIAEFLNDEEILSPSRSSLRGRQSPQKRRLRSTRRTGS